MSTLYSARDLVERKVLPEVYEPQQQAINAPPEQQPKALREALAESEAIRKRQEEADNRVAQAATISIRHEQLKAQRERLENRIAHAEGILGTLENGLQELIYRRDELVIGIELAPVVFEASGNVQTAERAILDSKAWLKQKRSELKEQERIIADFCREHGIN